MQEPRLIGVVLLAYLLLVLPWLAYRSAQRLRTTGSGGTAAAPQPLPPLTRIFGGTLLLMVALFYLAWLAGQKYWYAPFWYQSLGPREIGVGVLAFAGFLGLRQVNRAIRSPEERRAMAIRRLMPRTPPEWGLYILLGLAAGVTEEYAYRGVGMYALTLWIGSPWAAAAILSVAFGLAHLTQEWKSVGVIVVMAAVMHTLVALTDTLLVAMVVHTIYDWLAAVILRREMSAEVAAATAAG